MMPVFEPNVSPSRIAPMTASYFTPPQAHFISDLHLNEAQPEQTEAFLCFLAQWQQAAAPGEQLYILGDWFDVWTGDDMAGALGQKIAQACRACTRQSLRIFFLPGNRDFLMGRRFLDLAGITLLPDPCCITLNKQRILLTHGDALCQHDRSHQRFRRIMQAKLTRRLLLALPKKTRTRIGQALRKNSKGNSIQALSQSLIDFDYCRTWLKNHQASTMIHGHTHHALHEHIASDETPFDRHVLGAWETEQHRLSWCKDEGFHAHTAQLLSGFPSK
jgi:UDP-2,3-diacylglucosamine hydrolase